MFETRITATADLGLGIKKTYLNTLFAARDSEAHFFEVVISRDKVPINLPSGTVVNGYFIRYSDNATIPMTGSANGSVVTLTLSQACYNRSGQFAIVIKAVIDDEISTVFYGEGTMMNTVTDVYLDEENVIPSLDDLLAQIAVMERATADANAAMGNANRAADTADASAQNANQAADRANAEANAANLWAEATAEAVTLNAGEDADVSVATEAGSKKLTFSIPRGESGVYIGPEEPDDPTVQVWIDSDGNAEELPGGITSEDIQKAVDNYLAENPVTGGATAEQAAQIQKNKEAIEELKKNGTGAPGADGVGIVSINIVEV